MSLGADFLLPKASAVQADQSVRSSPKEAGQSGFSDIFAQAREGGEHLTGEAATEASSLGGKTQAANDQLLLAVDEQALAGLGNELPGNDLPLQDEALLVEPEAVSLESLMLFGRENTAPAPGTADVDAHALDEPIDPVVALEPDASQLLDEQTVAMTSQVAPTSAVAAQMSGIAQQAATSAAGIRPANPNLSEPRAAVRQAQAELNLAEAEALPETELAADGERDFTEVLRSSLSAAAGSAAASTTDGLDSPVNPLTQAVQQANAAQREAAANAMQQPLAMRQPGMSEAVVERVMWLSSQNLRSAEIQLDPAELGRLEIRISLNQEQTHISFASPHASVREALEGQMHRLREMFSQQGLDQFDVNVSDQSLARGERQADEQGAGGLAAGNSDADDAADAESLIASTPLDNGRGLVDFYA